MGEDILSTEEVDAMLATLGESNPLPGTKIVRDSISNYTPKGVNFNKEVKERYLSYIQPYIKKGCNIRLYTDNGKYHVLVDDITNLFVDIDHLKYIKKVG